MTQTPYEPGQVPVEPQSNRRRRVRGGATPSWVGSLWVASVLFAIVLLLLLIFVLQNGQSAKISFTGAHGNVPQGVALLLAAVFGILLVALPGTARIVQLRIRDRRHPGVVGISPAVTPVAPGPSDRVTTPEPPNDTTPPMSPAPISNPPAAHATVTNPPPAPPADQR
jgi:uncharacterized integral membrane protein